MHTLPGFGLSLGAIPLLSRSVTRSISAENPTGMAGGGAREVPGNVMEDHPASLLGQGWKVRPCISLEPESTTTLADIEGPGVIQHIWITVRPEAYRSCILRMHWDGEETPSVPFLGYPLWCKEAGEVPRHGLYRWHIMDPIRFQKKLKVTIQALGWWLNRKFEPLTDDISSVGYWYQSEPHAPFPAMPDLAGRWPR